MVTSYDIGRPFKNEPEEVRLLFEYIGRLSVHFSFLEGALDFACLIAFHGLQPRRKNKRIPTKFSDKIKLLNSCIDRFALDDFDKLTAQNLLDKFQDAAARRNDLIHPVIYSVDSSLIATALRIRRAEFFTEAKPVEISLKEVEELTREVHHLSNQAISLTKILITALNLTPSEKDGRLTDAGQWSAHQP